EDGIRDFHVTGVQTCALPILTASERRTAAVRSMSSTGAAIILYFLPLPLLAKAFYELVLRGRFTGFVISLALFALFVFGAELMQIGRASCRDSGSRSAGAARW